MKKKVDERVRTVIENGVKTSHRSMFLIVGDKAHYQIVNLHHMLRKASVKPMNSVLWCYRNRQHLSSHKRKRLKQVKKMSQRGLLDMENDSNIDPFLLFLDSGNFRYCKYQDTESILGGTYGMCVLQDFEGLTPNTLARTIETVEGGGLIVILLGALSSLSSLFTMLMDVHKRFRTESHSEATPRFNERFLLSLASCKACVVMDDEMNILPISSHIRSLAPLPVPQGSEGQSEAESDLKNLKEDLRHVFPVGPLVSKCRTLDQANVVINFMDALLEKKQQMTVALTAARGRGKSAALGLAIAGAVASGYSNLVVTAPSPENLKTLFDFVFQGLAALEYKEHIHYESICSTNPNWKKAVVRVNIHKQHRQTIQYIPPQERDKISQVELLVIDEAAAIPLPVVASLIGPYMVFLSSTVNGYEGTGRSLSLKLLRKLETQSHMLSSKEDGSISGALYRKLELNESIRYGNGDPIEAWLHGLLCLDAANFIPRLTSSLPTLSSCNLYYVNRDTLFSYHKDSELFLQRMMALYVSSHYKNSPNDLQLMADAPAHHMFVMLGPVDQTKNHLPDILCVIQVSLEGKISQASVLKSLSEGQQPSGDQIPWKFSEQFDDTVFPSLSGARIVRIAVHPDLAGAGYGSAAVDQLIRYYEGQLTPITENDVMESDRTPARITEAAKEVSLLDECIKPRSNLPPLLVYLPERLPEKLHYIGVSFGLSLQLYNFWIKNKFGPFYVSQIPNEVTGEHTCMVLKPLKNVEIEYSESNIWGFLDPFYLDFRQRFIRLLGSCFRNFCPILALSILHPSANIKQKDAEREKVLSVDRVMDEATLLSPHDMDRLDKYAKNFKDYHSILDLVPDIASAFFLNKLPIELNHTQEIVLLCMGLQGRDMARIKDLPLCFGRNKHGTGASKEVQYLSGEQVSTNFRKIMKKANDYLYNELAKKVEAALPRLKVVENLEMLPNCASLDDELNDAAKQVTENWKAESGDGLLNPDLLQQYAVVGKEAEFEEVLRKSAGNISTSGILSVRSSKDKAKAKEKNKFKGQGKEKGQSKKRKKF